MSEELDFHGPHDHAVEHGAHSGDSLAARVAVVTAILATVGAVVGYQGGSTLNEAMMYKNEAVLKKAAASDQWAFYQAKSSKQNLAELAESIAPRDKQDYYKQKMRRYEQEKTAIQLEAERLDAESTNADRASDKALLPHHRLAEALTLMQIAISLASITVLTRKTWLFWCAMGSAGVGAVMWVSTLFIR